MLETLEGSKLLTDKFKDSSSLSILIINSVCEGLLAL